MPRSATRPGARRCANITWNCPADPRYAKLAAEIVNSLKPIDRNQPFKKVLATRRRLEKNITYTKNPAPPGYEDATTAFLFGDRRGYCVHIAHAMAYLLRAQGIPTRVGAGYSVEPTSRQGSNLIVLDNAGHAWCEIYLQGIGWVVMDAAAEKTEEEPDLPPDPILIGELGELARRKPPAHVEPVDTLSKAPDAWMMVLTAVVGLLLSLYLVKIWRRLRPGWPVPGTCPASLIGPCWISSPSLAMSAASAKLARSSPNAWPRWSLPLPS